MKITVDENIKLPREKWVKSVWVDGKDITNLCTGFDTETGQANCFKTDDNGKILDDGQEVFKEVLHGKITFIREDGTTE